MKRLEYNELKRFCDVNTLGFDTTADLDCSLDMEIIGQTRAVSAFNFGLGTRRSGYNIYVAGVSGSGKTTFAAHFAKEAANKEAVPQDLAYVYNFKEPKNPKLLAVKAGKIAVFKEDLQELLDILTTEIPKILEDPNFEEQRNDIAKKFEKERDQIFDVFAKFAREYDFEVQINDKGMTFAPIIDGEPVSIDDFKKLDEALKETIVAKSETVQEEATDVMTKVRTLDLAARKQIDDLEYNILFFAVGEKMARLQEKYECEECILEYLGHLKEDILENIGNFYTSHEVDDDDAIANLIPWVSKKTKDDVLNNYRVNIIADNSGCDCAPVKIAVNPTFANIMGEIEYDSEMGNLVTDYMKIKGGLIHAANGGCLILQAKDVLTIPFLWEALKRTIRTKEIVVENPKEHQNVPVSTIRPELVAFNTKIILVGSNYYHDILRAYDEDFVDLFKVSAFFDYEMNYNEENITQICRFVKRFASEECTLDFSADAVAVVIEHSVRLAGSQKKLTSRFDRISELLCEADIWAKRDNSQIVLAKHVKEAIKQRDYRYGLYEEKMTELIESDVIMIDTDGTKIGQINGLAALDTGDAVFAKPTKITATTYVGKAGIINIENEVEMSGEIHSKGVQIVIGYLGQKYAQKFPLSLSCRIAFEQSYSGVDGDSASSTELYCIISSLSGLPINQGIAVSGSINQRGEIQAVGAITAKIEGFFDLCKNRGLTGTQGVIIPQQNITDLTLNDDVIEAVKDGKFHIYPIAHIDEGLEILLNTKAGDIDTENTIHARVYNRLHDFHKAAADE
ncbi:MAG: AAA family ATPase [Defluviitaleaceae bacterium]|nr:AAA family ATPase [Defluviitaleaceae bacterium]